MRRITNKEGHAHSLGKRIQNKIIVIAILASGIKERILMESSKSTYYSITLDSTPDLSHHRANDFHHPPC